MKTLFLRIIPLLLVSFSFLIVHADITATIKLDPANPLPNSSVSLTLESYSFNVDTAMITWKIGGRVVAQGEGEKKISVQTGGIGEAVKVNVLAENADGSSIEQTITINPSSVVLVYEAPKSYVPILYPGRSLPSDGRRCGRPGFPGFPCGCRRALRSAGPWGRSWVHRVCHAGSITSRASPAPICLPGRQCRARTVPVTGAWTGNSIFMASRMTRGSPASTA